MNILKEDALRRDISAENFARGYFLCGDDAYLKKYYADRIAGHAAGGDPFFNDQRFDGSCDLQELYDAVLQFPMMAERKCVTLTDFDIDRAAKSELDRLIALLGELNDTCVLILRFDSVEIDLKKNKKMIAVAAAMEAGGGKVIQLDHRSNAELARILTDGAAKRGCKMDPAAARYLIETSGSELAALRNELEKLCAYVHGGTVDRAAVDAVAAKSVDASVYELTGHIFGCNLTAALRMLDDLFFMRLEPMIILATISGTYVDLYRIFTAKKAGVTNAELAKAFGYGKRTFVLDRAERSLRKFTRQKLALSFDALLDADRQLKSFGGDPRTVLEELTVKLCCIIATGAAS